MYYLSIHYLFTQLVSKDAVCLIRKEIKDIPQKVFPLLHLAF